MSPAVSWLELELFALGELSPDRVAAVERALDENPVSRARLATIEAERLSLPALPVPITPAARRPRARLWSALALAAISLGGAVLLLRPSGGLLDGPPDSVARVKGGDVAIELVRDRSGVVDLHPDRYAPGDRFKVRLSCPPGSSERWDIVVIQAEERYFPLTSGAQPLPCHNGMTVPGAFTLTGTAPARVCAVWDAPDRSTLADPASTLPRSAVCATLRAEGVVPTPRE